MILSESEIRSYLYDAGFRGLNLNNAVRISFCESSFDTNAHNTSGEDSRGLMQINMDAHPEYLVYDMFDPSINTSIAYLIFLESGRSFRAWTCAELLGIIDGPGIPDNSNLILAGLAFIVFSVLYLK